jgi:hypothetical protein
LKKVTELVFSISGVGSFHWWKRFLLSPFRSERSPFGGKKKEIVLKPLFRILI